MRVMRVVKVTKVTRTTGYEGYNGGMSNKGFIIRVLGSRDMKG